MSNMQQIFPQNSSTSEKSNNCEVKDYHDLSKKLLQFQYKTGKDRMAALRANQRNIDNQNVKDNQNKWAEKSR